MSPSDCSERASIGARALYRDRGGHVFIDLAMGESAPLRSEERHRQQLYQLEGKTEMRSKRPTSNYGLVGLSVVRTEPGWPMRFARPLLDRNDASTQWYVGLMYHSAMA
jgi:hypothetical protein